MTSWHKTGAHPFYIGMYIHIYTHIYVHKYTSQKECLHIFHKDVLTILEQLAQNAPWRQLTVVHFESVDHSYDPSRAKVGIHPGKLTWNPKMEVWKMIFFLNWVIFRGVPDSCEVTYPPTQGNVGVDDYPSPRVK